MKDIEAINKFVNDKRVFDIVFLDPPYKLGKYEEIIDLLLKNNLISEHGIIVIESDHDVIIDNLLYKERRDYKYGEIKVAIIWR